MKADKPDSTADRGDAQSPAVEAAPASEPDDSLAGSDNIHIVLVNTTHAGNIGATARAMKNMGLRNLRLVEPCRYLGQEAMVRASGAGEILRQASAFPTLEEALSDCTLAVGTSARSRSLEGEVQTVRDAAAMIAKRVATGTPSGRHSPTPVAIVFGRERSGLSNEELALCDHRLTIPCNPDFSSLNLGSAVQVVAYELRQALLALSHSSVAGAGESAAGGSDLADNAALERFHAHLEQALVDIDFLDPDNPRLLMPRLRRYFIRNRPQQSELNILRGILTAVQKSAASGKTPADPRENNR